MVSVVSGQGWEIAKKLVQRGQGPCKDTDLTTLTEDVYLCCSQTNSKRMFVTSKQSKEYPNSMSSLLVQDMERPAPRHQPT